MATDLGRARLPRTAALEGPISREGILQPFARRGVALTYPCDRWLAQDAAGAACCVQRAAGGHDHDEAMGLLLTVDVRDLVGIRSPAILDRVPIVLLAEDVTGDRIVRVEPVTVPLPPRGSLRDWATCNGGMARRKPRADLRSLDLLERLGFKPERL
jgi:hypothetical protein